VHSLSLKRGSKLKFEEFDNKNASLAGKMIEYAHSALTKSGYMLYYLYRQKYMSGNLENTGYTLPGKQCVYNIDIMEETHSIIACGAGGISKTVIEDRVEREANSKDIKNYLERFNEMMNKRKALFNALK
jgi:oxygen-independent coproporphyrinogen-3 oxidase